VLLERAAGQPFADVLRTRLFEPLGMPGRRSGRRTPGGSRPRSGPLPAAGWRSGTSQRAWSGPQAFCDGASGLVSTADDLLAFTRMPLRGGPVLPAAAVAEMTLDQLTPAQKARGGLGPGFFDEISWGFCTSVVTAGARAGAFGWAGGFGTTWLADPVRDPHRHRADPADVRQRAAAARARGAAAAAAYDAVA
jgi:CubicO group peptidase (beta-lactamase class C family)